jgi:hypothetical protein
MKSKYLTFVELTPNPKTKVIGVVTKGHGQTCLGVIKWYPNWRQYAFFPNSETVFERICLGDITKFLEELMEERKFSDSKMIKAGIRSTKKYRRKK